MQYNFYYYQCICLVQSFNRSYCSSIHTVHLSYLKAKDKMFNRLLVEYELLHEKLARCFNKQLNEIQYTMKTKHK